MMTHQEVRDLHREAMQLVDLAFEARRYRDEERALKYFRRAYELESQAAREIAADLKNEPTRSILLRSAATLALDCGEIRAAEQLAAQGLAGNPPASIAEELRVVLEQSRFDRHLRLNEIILEPDEFQFVIDGPAIAPGMALMDVFIDRVRDVERIIRRTAARIQQQPFIEKLRSDIVIYLSTPRPASFAVSLKIGQPNQAVIPGFEDLVYDFSARIVDETLTCIDLVNRNREVSLKERFANTDPAYYQNFIALTQKIAPDGTDVSFVGFTTLRSGDERKVILNRPRTAIKTIPSFPVDEGSGRNITYTGRLRFADEVSEKNKIKIMTGPKKTVTITVPPGYMSDIVAPLWGKKVVVQATKYKTTTLLREIEEDEDQNGEELL